MLAEQLKVLVEKTLTSRKAIFCIAILVFASVGAVMGFITPQIWLDTAKYIGTLYVVSQGSVDVVKAFKGQG